MLADRPVGIVVGAAGVALAAMTSQLDILANQPTLSARFFPYCLAIVLVACGGALFCAPGAGLLRDVAGRFLTRGGLTFAALFLVYALSFRFVDFRLGTFLFVLLAMWGLGTRSWLELLAVPATTSAAIYVLFRYGFTVLLPVWT